MTDDRARWSGDDIGVVVCGLVVGLVASLPWYVVRLGPGEDEEFRAWDLGAFSVVLVLLSVYAAGRVVWLHYRPLKPEVPLTPGVEPFITSLVAMLLTMYRSLDVPTVPLASRVDRTVWLIVALFVVTLQVAFAARSVARTGFRA